MITTGFPFIAVMAGLCGILVWIEQQYPSRLFKWFPSIVLVMFGSMALYTFGLWEMSSEVKTARASVRDNLIPAMLFLMSLKFDLSIIRKLGIRLITMFLGSTITIMLGFIIVQQIMGPLLGDETPYTFGVMSAGWTGGTQNFVAVKEALNVSDSAMAYTLLMGALCYSVWLIIIIAMKPFKAKFSHFLRADNSGLDKVLEQLQNVGSTEKPDFQALMLMLGLSLIIAALSHYFGGLIAATGLFSAMVWAIIISSLSGMILAPTKLGKMGGGDEVSTIMLYIIVALIGAEVNLSAITKAPLYILSGVMILTIHGALLLLLGRLLKLNLHICGIASIANIGSAPSAAVVAAAYDKNLMPIAIIMALIGSMVGSFVGLLVSEILVWLG
ncbi:DUF819 domain-containing protein [Endozoicomonas elysicola]|uniref:DUF819 domain-containing protein n=1 Tax=Endozoicomonas elysicola TaxID=305900 RepID=A0A081KA60_9GAMM|nr:DUF819 family protein [Endozoicomonas elysicola]KEI71036.1 hypothetical protein GV64_10015 [Endozoicomonas elysicola]